MTRKNKRIYRECEAPAEQNRQFMSAAVAARREPRPPDDRNRRAMSLIEIIVALVVLGAVASVTVQGLTSHARQRRAQERRVFALETAASALERFTARPYEAIASGEALKVSEATAAALPEAELRVEVEPSAAPPEGKRVRLALRWKGRGGQPQTVHLTTWVYRRAGRTP